MSRSSASEMSVVGTEYVKYRSKYSDEAARLSFAHRSSQSGAKCTRPMRGNSSCNSKSQVDCLQRDSAERVLSGSWQVKPDLHDLLKEAGASVGLSGVGVSLREGGGNHPIVESENVSCVEEICSHFDKAEDCLYL